jgi:hypothetical protein
VNRISVAGARAAGWACAAGLIVLMCESCSSVHATAAAHFDQAARLVMDGDWDSSLLEFEEGCRLAADDPTRAACEDKERKVYAGHGKSDKDKSDATATASATGVAVIPVVPGPVAAPAGAQLLQGAPQPNAYAVIVGIEHYEGLPAASGARRDAERFALMATLTLGVAAEHAHIAFDGKATKGGIERDIEWARSNVPKGGRVYFYFSGHGSPDATSGSAYLLPSDGDPKFLKQSALLVKDVVATLADSGAKDVLVTLDSCFSGAGGRSVLPPGARPLVRVREVDASANVAVFTAASGAEISGPASDGSSGLFSSYVVQGVGRGMADANGDGQVSLQELSDWVTPRVRRDALKDGRSQTPHLAVGGGLGGANEFLVAWGLPAK